MEPSHRLLFLNFHHKFEIGFKSRLFTKQVIDFNCHSWSKDLIPFTLWQEAFLSWKKLLHYQMYPCALIVEVMAAIYTCSLNDLQPSITNDLGKFTCFSSGSHLYVSLEQHQMKIPALSSWPMEILHWSLNISLIQLSTHHDCFSYVHSNLIFYFLCVSIFFVLHM